MSAAIDEQDVTVLQGDVREQLATLPEQSVDCIVTSPPYYGLRDYGVPGQIGCEATPGEYVDAILSVVADLGRVLRPDGTLWLNLGDAYSGKANGGPSFDRHRGHGHAAGVVAKQVNTTGFARTRACSACPGASPWR